MDDFSSKETDFSRSSFYRSTSVPPPHTIPAASFFSSPPGTAAGYQREPRAGLPAPLTSFSSPPIFPEGLLAFSSDIGEPRREDGNQKRWSGGRGQRRPNRDGMGLPGTLLLSHVVRKDQLMQSESAQTPPPNQAGVRAANR